MVTICAACLAPCKYPFPLIFVFSYWWPFWNFKNKEQNFDWWSIFVSSFKRIRCTEWIIIFCTLVTMATFWIFATHYGGYSYKVSWSLMKGITKKLIPPFLFPWQLRQSLSNRFRFFGLSRSTRCGCCSYQVSSISVRRVTCYNHFCVFSIF